MSWPVTVADLSAALATLPPRFHLATTPPPGAVCLADLADPATARDLLERHRTARRLDEQLTGSTRATLPGQITASLAVQGIGMHLYGAVLAGVVQHRLLLLAEPEDVHVAPVGPAFAVAVTNGRLFSAGTAAELLPAFVQVWVDRIGGRLVDDLRRVQRVGEALLRGNLASAVAATFVFFDWWDPACGARELAEVALTHGRPPLGAHARVADLTVDDRVGLRSERTACCLLAKVPDAHLCPTCPLSTAEERAAATAEHVHHLFAVRSGAASGPPPWAVRR